MMNPARFRSLIAGILMLASLDGAAAETDAATLAELEALRAQVAAMQTKLHELDALVRRNSASAAAPSPADALKSPPPASAPASRVTFAGDVRMRSESTDEEDRERRDRSRVRMRAGLSAKITDSVTAGARIATGGRDPRTSNATLSGENAKKDVGVDLAYVQWRGAEDVRMTAGKMDNPQWRPRLSMFQSGEVTPEGLSINYGGPTGWFGGASHFWLEERSADDDSAMHVGQVGYRWQGARRERLTVALSYHDHRHVQNYKPFFEPGNSYGNSVLPDGSLANDFDVLGIATEWDDTLLLQPFSVFGEFAQNTAADDLNIAAAVGASFGDASQARGWQLSYQYEWLEKDALFAQTINADFSGGVTDTRGHVMKLAYGLAKNWSLTFTMMLSDLNMDVGQERAFRRAQLDLHAKY